jgi:hypothetical protein
MCSPCSESIELSGTGTTRFGIEKNLPVSRNSCSPTLHPTTFQPHTQTHRPSLHPRSHLHTDLNTHTCQQRIPHPYLFVATGSPEAIRNLLASRLVAFTSRVQLQGLLLGGGRPRERSSGRGGTYSSHHHSPTRQPNPPPNRQHATASTSSCACHR